MNDLLWMISHELYSVLYNPESHTTHGTKLEITKEPAVSRTDLPVLVRPTPMRRER